MAAPACRPAFSLFFPSFFYSQTFFLLLCFPLALPGDLVATPDRVAGGRQGIRTSSEPWPWVAPGALLWHGRSPNLPGVWGGSGGFCLLHPQHLALCWPCCPSLVRLLLVAPRSLRWAFFLISSLFSEHFFAQGLAAAGRYRDSPAGRTAPWEGEGESSWGGVACHLPALTDLPLLPELPRALPADPASWR